MKTGLVEFFSDHLQLQPSTVADLEQDVFGQMAQQAAVAQIFDVVLYVSLVPDNSVTRHWGNPKHRESAFVNFRCLVASRVSGQTFGLIRRRRIRSVCRIVLLDLVF
jgi:hypothetical protein